MFKSVCLFGYSPIFKDIEIICQKLDIDLTIICGNRQLKSIEDLELETTIVKNFTFTENNNQIEEKVFNSKSEKIGLIENENN